MRFQFAKGTSFMLKRFLLVFCATLLSVGAQAQGRELPDFTDLVEKQGPAVVNIGTTQVIHAERGGSQMPFDENDPSFEFFRRFFPHQPGMPGMPGTPGVPHDFENKSLGSGFIISSDGYILTNAHVIDSADEVVVNLTDKREFKAKVIGADKRSDVALIKIEASGLPTVKIGDSSRLKVGEWVVAIGSPFGFENSVTAGIVSAKGRSLPQENYVPFIQTDAAVNPGNSGGPLFNMKGEVIGINSQIYSRSGGFMGLSFAIPIDLAMDVQAQIKHGGKVHRGRLGVVIRDVTKDLADSFGLSKAEGAFVDSVEKGQPADKAGIEAGDVITKFDGKAIGQSSDLPRVVGATRPGNQVQVQVWRKGATKDFTVAIAEMPEEKALSQHGSKRGKSTEPAAANRLGLVLSELGADQKRELKVNGGLLIEDVRGSGVRYDLRTGDIILALIAKGNQTELRTVEQFNSALSAMEKSSVFTLLIRRGDSQSFVTVKGLGDKDK
jgi:serine protease Do